MKYLVMILNKTAKQLVYLERLLIESSKFAIMIKRCSIVGPFLKSLIVVYIMQTFIGCANIVPPSGGPRDSIPPYLVAAKPKDSAVNIQPKEIWLGFNEYINATSLQENVIVSPTLKNNPLFDAKLNTIRIRISDTLAPNTTYNIQFGQSIRDVNEGNIANKFSYTFSTGPTIDTGGLRGTVRLAETGRVDSTLIVVLHPTGKDSAVNKDKPMYYSRVDGKGRFEFRFLPYKSFQIFALPNDYTKRYDDSTKLIAYLDSTITVGTTKDSIRLFAFEAAKKVEKKKTIQAIANKNLKRNTASIRYGKNLDGSEQDLLKPLHLIFETPIHLNDSFPILLCDTNNKPIEGFTVKLDTGTHQHIIIDYPWRELTKLHLIVPKNALNDSLNNTLVKADTIKFVTKSTAAYGAAMIRIAGYQQYTNPILLLTKDEAILYQYPITKNLLNIAMLPPGEYVLKILEDKNGNGKWDTGKYGKQKLQPEIIQVLKSSLNIKADWDNELNLIINK